MAKQTKMLKKVPEENVQSSSVKQSPVVAEGKAIVENIDPHDVIQYPLSTEKSIRQIEFDNKLIFAVNPRATKNDVKKAVEQLFNVKVAKVNIQNSFNGYKKAYVKLAAESLASDVSADLGLI